MAQIEVSNVTVSRKSSIAGDEVAVDFTFTNTIDEELNLAIKQLRISIGISGLDFPDGNMNHDYHFVDVVGKTSNKRPSSNAFENVNIPRGESRSYSASFVVPSEVNDIFALFPEQHAVPLKIMIVLNYNADDPGGLGFRVSTGSFVLGSLYSPQVSLLKLERATNGLPNDEGVNVLSTIKLDVAEGADTSGMFAMLYYAVDEPPTTDSDCIDLTASIPDLLSGVNNNASLIEQTFSNGSNWGFLLVFGDQYEETRARYTVSRAFANMHLSGKPTGGVCFGGFSTSEDGSPKFECYYPAYFYGGIVLGGGGGGGITPASAIKTIAQSQFQNNAEVEAVDLPGATTLNTYAFQNCTSLKTVNLPLVATIPAYCFSGCSALEKVDLGAATSLAGAAFQNCSSMSTLILRASSRAAVLASTFTGSGVALKTCMIYVPSALVASYQGASVWSTYKDQIFAIEDYPEITGG